MAGNGAFPRQVSVLPTALPARLGHPAAIRARPRAMDRSWPAAATKSTARS